MNNIVKLLVSFLLIASICGCGNASNSNENSHSQNKKNSNPQNTESNQQTATDHVFDIYSGPGEDYYLEGQKKKVKAFRKYNDWYEVEYSGGIRGYVKKDEFLSIDDKNIEYVVSRLTYGPTERKEVVELDAEYTLTGDIELREAPNDNSNVLGTVDSKESVKIINLEPLPDNPSIVESMFPYWQVDVQTLNGKVRGYVRSDDLFDYFNPIKGFEIVKEQNAKISYEGNDYYSSTGAKIDGAVNDWHLEKSFKIKESHFSILGGIAGIIGCDYDPEELLVQKSINIPTVTKGKKNYHGTAVAVDASNEKLMNGLTAFGVALDWIPAFIEGGYSAINFDVELLEYEGERKIVLRTETPIELQCNNGNYAGKTFDLSDLVATTNGTIVGASDAVDKAVRKAYPNFTGEKKYSVKMTFADADACAENPFGHYLIIDKDLNVYTQLIHHSGTQAIIYYDRKPIYDATWDLLSLQQLDEAASKSIIDLLMKYGFSFTTVDSVSGEEQHSNASQTAGDVNQEEIIEQYKTFIQSQNTGNDYQNYIIYDIDKDGYPELLILTTIPEERRSVYEIYSYKSGSFEFKTQCKNCLPHGPAAYASYPNGNGMIAHYSFRGAEGVILLSLNGYEMQEEQLYLERIEEHPTQFYLDEYDPIYADSYNHNNYLNHQFYVGEAASPYCDGSYMLGQSAMDDFTAVYEAFGVKEDADTSTESSDSAFMGISVLNKGTENNITVNGKSFRIRYDSAESSDRYIGLNLYVNNIAESYRLDSILSPYLGNVYVTDIDINDSYYNIAVVISGEDEDCSTYLFAFNDSEINMIQAFNGRLVPESANGNGTVLLQYVLGMGIQDYGMFCVRPEISVNNLSAEQVDLHSGRMIYSEAGSTYEDEFLVPLSSDLTVYAEPECVSAAGIIPAGTDIKCEYVMHSDIGNLFYVTGASASGYVNSGMLKASCKDLYFAG